MKRSWYEMQAGDQTIIEPCPSAIGTNALPVPRALAGWPRRQGFGPDKVREHRHSATASSRPRPTEVVVAVRSCRPGLRRQAWR